MLNVELLGKSELELALMRHWFAIRALKGAWPYETKIPNIRAVAMLPSIRLGTFLAIRADIGIKSFKDLVKKHYPLKIKGGQHGDVEDLVLKEYGTSLEGIESWGGKHITGGDGFVEEYRTAEQIANGLKAGKIDAVYGSGTQTWGRIVREVPLNFPSISEDVIERLREKYDHTFVKVRPNTIYIGQDQEFHAPWFPGFLVATREDAPDEMIRAVVRVIHENSLEIASCQQQMVGRPGIHMANTWGVPLHSAAAEYYKELAWIP